MGKNIFRSILCLVLVVGFFPAFATSEEICSETKSETQSKITSHELNLKNATEGKEKLHTQIIKFFGSRRGQNALTTALKSELSGKELSNSFIARTFARLTGKTPTEKQIKALKKLLLKVRESRILILQTTEAIEQLSKCLVTTPPPLNNNAAAECAALGGEWKVWGFELKCRLPSSDAGKTCSKRSDCTVACVTSSQTPVGTSTTGICFAYSFLDGSCFQYVNDGVASPSLCSS